MKNFFQSHIETALTALPERCLFYDFHFQFQFKTYSVSQSDTEIVNEFLISNKNKLIEKLNCVNHKYEFISDLKSSHLMYYLECCSLEYNDQNNKLQYFRIKITELTEEQKIKNQIEAFEKSHLSQNKNSELAEISAGIGHEINNPLTIIVAKTQFVKAHLIQLEFNKKEKILDSLDKIDQYAERITQIIKSLKSFSRSTLADDFETVDVHSLISDSLMLLNRELKNNVITVDVKSLPKQIYVYCNSSEIIQIIVNLIKNSIYAVKEVGFPLIEIQVKTEMNEYGEPYGLICISDNGVGISKEKSGQIFNSFYTTKPPGEGTGLGLSLSKHLALKNKGDLYLDVSSFTEDLSKKQKTCFCLQLVWVKISNMN